MGKSIKQRSDTGCTVWLLPWASDQAASQSYISYTKSLPRPSSVKWLCLLDTPAHPCTHHCPKMLHFHHGHTWTQTLCWVQSMALHNTGTWVPLERRPATAWLICSWCPACQRLLSMGTGCKWDKPVQQWQCISWHLICAHTDKVWSDGAQQGPTAPASMQQWWAAPTRVPHGAHTMLQRLLGKEEYRETSTGGMNSL